MSVVDLTEHTWGRFIKSSDVYVPIIERLVAYYLMHDHRSNEDHDPCGQDAIATVPGLKDLSDRELEFVFSGAQAVYYEDDTGYLIRGLVKSWIADGAPS